MNKMKKTRKELMIELNQLLETDYNWSRISLLDLIRLTRGIRKCQKLE